MAMSRVQLVSLDAVPNYHCVPHCVQRQYLSAVNVVAPRERTVVDKEGLVSILDFDLEEIIKTTPLRIKAKVRTTGNVTLSPIRP